MGEVFVAGAENTESPGFGILRPVRTAPCGDEPGSRRIRTDHGHGGSQEGEWVYTDPVPGAKMEILANWAYLDHLLIPPGASVGRHIHTGVDESFYVMAGESAVQVGEETASLRPGDGVPAPAGDVHSFRNDSPAPVEFVVLGLAKDKRGLDTTR